ncbi:MAG: DUF4249 domain-containing protein [Bacteroidales bacterium]|nr:DUF4249 domain-containing protein [Bacteroidales bacterium]
MYRRFIILLTLLVSLVSCTKEGPARAGDSQLVVEGWIESGKAPVVLVSSSIEASGEHRYITDLADNILRYAKVTVEHDGTVYPLSARLSDSYFLRNYFTSGRIIGEPGEEYTLRVEWDGKTATATTVIPEPRELDELTVIQSEASDTLFTIKARFRDNPDRKEYYKFFTRVVEEGGSYGPAYLGDFEGTCGDYNFDVFVNRSAHLPQIFSEIYYKEGETVDVKFATCDAVSYSFWKNFEENSMSSIMPIVMYFGNCYGNVEGGLGYWAGYGINEYRVCIE